MPEPNIPHAARPEAQEPIIEASAIIIMIEPPRPDGLSATNIRVYGPAQYNPQAVAETLRQVADQISAPPQRPPKLYLPD